MVAVVAGRSGCGGARLARGGAALGGDAVGGCRGCPPGGPDPRPGVRPGGARPDTRVPDHPRHRPAGRRHRAVVGLVFCRRGAAAVQPAGLGGGPGRLGSVRGRQHGDGRRRQGRCGSVDRRRYLCLWWLLLSIPALWRRRPRQLVVPVRPPSAPAPAAAAAPQALVSDPPDHTHRGRGIPTGLDHQPGRTLTQLIGVLLRCGHRWCSSQVSMSPSNPGARQTATNTTSGCCCRGRCRRRRRGPDLRPSGPGTSRCRR
ncbi:hypothetical protein EDD30_6584 [Couchioplanes caeruleus]|uniref:Uncharacterized protein n=1 Tax=Couchioplanes caeruleus TaxID=56438 RepID=A0A3N1GTJ2_9ACTN|nr:hypothetical protein EDD30_6584 [Couchioplanes caeruleus]